MTAPAPQVQYSGVGVIGADQYNTFPQVCLSYAQMRTFSALSNMVVMALGGASAGDGDGGIYYWNSTSTATDNGSSVIVPTGNIVGAWLRIATFTIPPSGAVTVTTTPYTIPPNSGDTLVNVASAATIHLPSAASESDPLSIVDISGAAATNNITIVPNGSDLIIGQSTWVISQSYGAVTLYPKAGGWYLK